ncbi:MAG: hypothetical protein HC922_09065 [Leptolyngbyaceae cyanobacterium SM2_3_12]|nr:hypothetical protein [Leptolyngbyaceae cyanobacterium SM2_3_12]
MDSITQFRYLSETPTQPIALGTLLRPVALLGEGSAVDYLPWESQIGSALTLQPTAAMVLAQQFDQDILGDIVNAWNNFIQSGQVWALIIGIALGYFIRNLTAF